MKLSITITAFLIGMPSVHSETWHSRWDRSGTVWLEKWENTLRSVDSLSKDEQIEILGAAVRIRNTHRMTEEQKHIFLRAQTALLSIPGHAEYYRDRMNRAQAERKPFIGDVGNFSIKSHQFMDEQDPGLQTLRNLPSPETVRVLGDLLADEWESGFIIQDGWKERTMAAHAVGTLAYLPIVDKPKAESILEEGVRVPHLPTWQAWYEQIKSGNRTFRFEGDPVEYDLNGPAPKEKLVRIERARKRDAERVAGERRSTPTGDEITSKLSKPTTMLSIVAACVALLTVGVYGLKRSKAA